MIYSNIYFEDMANGRGTFMLYHNEKAPKRIHETRKYIFSEKSRKHIHFSGGNVTGLQC
jgi:hypothetical protein